MNDRAVGLLEQYDIEVEENLKHFGFTAMKKSEIDEKVEKLKEKKALAKAEKQKAKEDVNEDAEITKNAEKPDTVSEITEKPVEEDEDK